MTRRPWSLDDVPRPALEIVASWVLGNGYCPGCGEPVSPDMELEARELACGSLVWCHEECGEL